MKDDDPIKIHSVADIVREHVAYHRKKMVFSSAMFVDYRQVVKCIFKEFEGIMDEDWNGHVIPHEFYHALKMKYYFWAQADGEEE